MAASESPSTSIKDSRMQYLEKEIKTSERASEERRLKEERALSFSSEDSASALALS